MKNDILPNIRYSNRNIKQNELTYYNRSNIYNQFSLKNNNSKRGFSKDNISNTNYNSSNGILISYINQNDNKNYSNNLKKATIIQRGDQNIKNYYDDYFMNKKGTIVLKSQKIKKKNSFKKTIPYRNKINPIESLSNYAKSYRNENINFKYNFTTKKQPNNNKKKCPLCHKEIDQYKLSFHINLHPSQIFPWLYLGSYRNACDKNDLKDLNVTHILNCAIECYNRYPNEFVYCHIKLNDLPSFNLNPYLNQAINFIDNAHKNNGNILIHCQLGISRSTSCVIAFMIKVMKFTTMEALEFIKRKRKLVMPNYGFLEQLIKFEKTVLENEEI